MESLLVVVAHPDDEILGCGGFLEREDICEKWTTHIHIVGKGRGDPQDQRFDEFSLNDWIEEVEEVIAVQKPSLVITHNRRDQNKDHRIIAQAILIASRAYSTQTVKEIWSMEIPQYLAMAQKFLPNIYCDISDSLQKKIELLKTKYPQEVREFPHPCSPEAIRALAQWRGSQVGLFAAEAFELVRKVL